MRYRLSTLLILAALLPPLIAAIVRSPIALIHWFLSLAFTIVLAYAFAALGGLLSGRR
jgi:hypothetical protein